MYNVKIFILTNKKETLSSLLAGVVQLVTLQYMTVCCHACRIVRKTSTITSESNSVTNSAIVESFVTITRIFHKVLVHTVTLGDSIRWDPSTPNKLFEKICRWEYIDLSKLITEDANIQVTSAVIINRQLVTVEPMP